MQANEPETNDSEAPNDAVMTIRLPSQTIERLERAAFKLSSPGNLVSRAAAVRMAIEEWIDRTAA